MTPETAEANLWFLLGPPEDEPDFLPPLPRAEADETSVIDDWRRASGRWTSGSGAARQGGGSGWRGARRRIGGAARSSRPWPLAGQGGCAPAAIRQSG